jgi:hypothetical protein
MQTHTVEQLIEMAKAVNGKARNRTIGKREAQEIIDLVNQHRENQDTHTIRVYSLDGFVANSYNYRADIRYFEATRNADGEFVIKADMTGAKRGYGSGALVTINGRSA